MGKFKPVHGKNPENAKTCTIDPDPWFHRL